MTTRFPLALLTLLLAACAVGTPNEQVAQANWHLSTTVHRSASLPTCAVAPAGPERQRGRMRFVSTAYRTAAPTLIAAPAVIAKPAATLAFSAELVKADSLLAALEALNRAADTSQQAQSLSVSNTAVKLRKRNTRRKSFDFRPTNIKHTDTVFVDTLGVRFAMWLSPEGVQLKVGDGVLSKGGNGSATVRPGFDWQPYRLALLIIGTAAAVSIVMGLSVISYQRLV